MTLIFCLGVHIFLINSTFATGSSSSGSHGKIFCNFPHQFFLLAVSLSQPINEIKNDDDDDGNDNSYTLFIFNWGLRAYQALSKSPLVPILYFKKKIKRMLVPVLIPYNQFIFILLSLIWSFLTIASLSKPFKPWSWMPTNSLLAWKLDFWETSSLSTETQKVSRVTVEDQTRFSFSLCSCVPLVFLVGFPSLLQDHETQGPVFHLNYFFYVAWVQTTSFSRTRCLWRSTWVMLLVHVTVLQIKTCTV